MEATKPKRSNTTDIYEAYIKRLSNKEKLEIIALAAADMAEEVPDTRKLHDPMEFAGVAKNNPIGMDATEYIRAMRDEWDDES